MHTVDTYQISRQKPAVVYWVHYLEHTDPNTQGYIGVSTQLQKRILTHLQRSPHVGNRIKAGAVVTILHEVDSLTEAAVIEFNYRPTEHVGWNINKGGDVPPNKAGKVITGNQTLIGEQRTEEQKRASAKHSERMKGRTPWNKGKQGLQVPWNKGVSSPHLKEIANTKRICPHCGREGKGSSMLRWHFDNCKMGG